MIPQDTHIAHINTKHTFGNEAKLIIALGNSKAIFPHYK